jgi:hypothetical protein
LYNYNQQNMRFRYLILILAMLISHGIFSQLNLHPTTKKEKRQLNNRVLNNTDHGYFGFETGVLLDFSSTMANDPTYQNRFRNEFRGKLWEDLLFTRNGRLFGGYRYRSHYFEAALATYLTNTKTTNGEIAVKFLGACQLGYYYKLPIKSDFYNLCLGPEIGIAFKLPWDNYDWQDNQYYPPDVQIYPKANFLFGLSARNEFKVAKNLTLFCRVSGTCVPNINAFYWAQWYPVQPQSTSLTVTSWNFVISIGAKFDFFSKKKKQQTFDQLGIEDPYKK